METQSPVDLINDRNPDYYDFPCYAIILPAIATLGVFGNALGFFVMFHPEMRSFSSMLIHGLLVSDSVYLICVMLCRTPVSWLMHWFSISTSEPDFWKLLDYVQRLYLGAVTFKEISWCLIVWYTVVILTEQLCVYVCPVKLSKWSKLASAVKITITIPILALLIHLLSFFKFTRIAVNYHAFDHKMICLSELYRSSKFQVYDTYIYMIIFIFIPAMAACASVPKMLYAYKTSKYPDMTAYNRTAHLNQEIPLGRVFKSGRSTHIVLALSVVFFACQLVTMLIYLEVVVDLDVNPLSAKCHKLPVDRTFENQSPHLQRAHYFVSVLYAAINFPLFLIFGKDFRATFLKLCSKLRKTYASSATRDPPHYSAAMCEGLFEEHRRRLQVHLWMDNYSTTHIMIISYPTTVVHKYQWSDSDLHAFNAVKTLLASAATLSHPEEKALSRAQDSCPEIAVARTSVT
ncbi:hypothetical protein CAPTEDRAFT_208242 [Capitella teleta]|uniref:G-protein coupled receptors family 1 profile domain-containing protein n=1 Tax=Capitella teleta TaxID=283909 RepID=R7TYW0_CAPTE|nr:hypothetical protein CAPTEDRAFT_208242 [Capitella teleta]|eukprot:ELT96145.1 hypothetical protein CAPTEDRAFT_208242 [Capitella teleta]